MIERLSELRARVANVEANLGEAHTVLTAGSQLSSPYDADPAVLLAHAQQTAAAAEATAAAHAQQQQRMAEQVELLQKQHAELEQRYKTERDALLQRNQELQEAAEAARQQGAPSKSNVGSDEVFAPAQQEGAASVADKEPPPPQGQPATTGGVSDRRASRRRSSRDRPVPHPAAVQLMDPDEALVVSDQVAAASVSTKGEAAAAGAETPTVVIDSAPGPAGSRESPPPPPPSTAQIPRRPSGRIFVGKDGTRQISSPVSSSPAPSIARDDLPTDDGRRESAEGGTDSPVPMPAASSELPVTAVASPAPVTPSKLAQAAGVDTAPGADAATAASASDPQDAQAGEHQRTEAAPKARPLSKVRSVAIGKALVMWEAFCNTTVLLAEYTATRSALLPPHSFFSVSASVCVCVCV